MKFKPENGRRLIQQYLTSARERIESAKALLAIGNYEDAISRSYYAMLDAASALLITKDLVPQSHAGTIGLFSQHFVQTGLVPSELGRWFNKMEEARLDADYWHERKFTQAEAEEAIQVAEQFVQTAERLIPPQYK